MNKYVIEISGGSKKMWVATWEGDPPRTLKKDNAQTFTTPSAANQRITEVKQTHPSRTGLTYKVVPK